MSVRGEALAFLREQFALSSAGSGRLVLVSGSVASGKSQLMNEFIHFAAESGALTLSATGAPDEQTLSAGVIDQLFTNSALPAEVADQVSEILDPAHAKRRYDNLTDSRISQAGTPIAREICQILLRCARDQSVVLGVDDLQFADDTSLQLLLQLQRRIRSVRLLIVLNQLDRPAARVHQLHAYVTRLPHHHVQLAPMSRRAIHDLVGESLPVAVGGDQLAGQLHELTAGNPMLVSALIDDYRGGDQSGNPVVGPAFSHAVLTLLRRWDWPLRDVAAALALLGERGTADLVARLVGITIDAAEEMMATLTGVGLFAEGRFRHAEAEAAALDSLSPVARSTLHARAAELKHRQSAPAEEVAAHLVAAGQATAGWSIQALQVAAEQAVLADDVRFAAQCLELASSACTDPAERHEILSTLAHVTWRVNPSAASCHLTSLRQAAPDGAGCVDPLALARHALWNGDEPGFAGALDALHASPDPIDPRTQAELTLASRWHFGPGGRPVDTHPSQAPRHADPWNHTAVTLARIWSVGTSDATTASAESILRNCPLQDTTLEALATAITALAYDDRGERAEHWCATLSEQAARRGAVTWHAMLEGIWAGVALRRGDVANAAARARSALGLLGTQGWGVSIGYPLTTLLLADTATAAYDTASKTLRHPVPDSMFNTVAGLRYLRARGRYHLATDRVLAAISDFQQCRRLMVRKNMDVPALVPWRSDLAEANLRLGNIALARELAKQQLDRSAETDAYSRGSALRILALVGAPADRSGLLLQAAEYFKRTGDRLETTRTLKVAEQTHQLVRRLETVQPNEVPGQRALRALPALPSPAAAPLTPDATVAGSTAGSTGEAGESTTLSEAELRVAQLAARGMTNRQIGRSLFITVSTVEQHLTRVYRKLRIRGRSELPTQLTSTA